jgi:hypothetical protein
MSIGTLLIIDAGIIEQKSYVRPTNLQVIVPRSVITTCHQTLEITGRRSAKHGENLQVQLAGGPVDREV